LNTSDLPAGVVNIVTGKRAELIEPMGNHMDVNATVYSGSNADEIKKLKELAVQNVKRVKTYNKKWMNEESQDLYMISDLQEVKTTWHPIENIGGATSSY